MDLALLNISLYLHMFFGNAQFSHSTLIPSIMILETCFLVFDEFPLKILLNIFLVYYSSETGNVRFIVDISNIYGYMF